MCNQLEVQLQSAETSMVNGTTSLNYLESEAAVPTRTTCLWAIMLIAVIIPSKLLLCSSA